MWLTHRATTAQTTVHFLFDGHQELMKLSETKAPVVTFMTMPGSWDQRLYSLKDQHVHAYLTDQVDSIRGTVIQTTAMNPLEDFAYYAFGNSRLGQIEDLDFGYTSRMRDDYADLMYYVG